MILTYPLVFTGLRDGAMALPSGGQESFFLTTLGLLAIITGLALAVENVGFVCNFSGAIFGAFIVFVFPAVLCVLSIRAHGNKSNGNGSFEEHFAKLTIVGGVVLAIL